MSNRKKFEKWGAVALVAFCVFLAFRLVREILGNPVAEDPDTTISTPAPIAASPAANAQAERRTAASMPDSSLQVQPLDVYAPKPLPDISRDPFDFGAPPLTPAQKAAQEAQAARAVAARSRPVRPQIPLRAIGYTVKAGVGPVAFLADSNRVYVVRQGAVVSRRYKVLRITPSIVEIQDGDSGERAQLPIPRVQ